MPLSICDYCENLCCENHTLLKDVNESLSIFSTIFIQFGKKIGAQKLLVVEFHENGRNALLGYK
jgi:hypothetical protein